MTSGWFPPNGLAVMTNPPFAPPAKAATADSMAPASCRPTALNSIPNGGRRLDGGELTDAGGNGGISQHHRARDARGDFLEQFEPFRTDGVFEGGEPGGIAARPRQAID